MTTAINEMLNNIEAPVKENNAPAKAVAQETEGTPRIINIYSFSHKDGKLVINYETSEGKAFCRCHPAMKVKPLMHQDIQAIVYEDPKGYQLIYPAPTKAEITEYETKMAMRNAPKPEVKKIKLTPEMKAYLASF